MAVANRRYGGPGNAKPQLGELSEPRRAGARRSRAEVLATAEYGLGMAVANRRHGGLIEVHFVELAAESWVIVVRKTNPFPANQALG
jgi:hypothetical protein